MLWLKIQGKKVEVSLSLQMLTLNSETSIPLKESIEAQLRYRTNVKNSLDKIAVQPPLDAFMKINMEYK